MSFLHSNFIYSEFHSPRSPEPLACVGAFPYVPFLPFCLSTFPLIESNSPQSAHPHVSPIATHSNGQRRVSHFSF